MFIIKKIGNVFKFMFENYRKFLLILYIPLYWLCFSSLESHDAPSAHIIHSILDDKIPFCEIFIVPYLFWFVYLAFGVCYTIFQKEGRHFYHMGTALFLGMTPFIIISFIWPNILELRPTVFPRDNIFTDAVKWLYSVDTPTNVLPSIHVYNSIIVHFGLCHTRVYRERRSWRIRSLLFTILIVMSTLFLKQHSVVDASCGLGMAAGAWVLVYGPLNGWVIKMWKAYDKKHY